MITVQTNLEASYHLAQYLRRKMYECSMINGEINLNANIYHRNSSSEVRSVTSSLYEEVNTLRLKGNETLEIIEQLSCYYSNSL